MVVHFRDLEARTVEFVGSAHHRLLVASYATPSPIIMESMIRKKPSLQDCKMVLNMQTARRIFGVPTRYLDAGSAMHHKFIVADDSVLFGSYNFSGAGSYDCIAIVEDLKLANQFALEFDSIWANAKETFAAYTVEDLKKLLQEVVSIQGGWSNFTTNLSRTLASSRSISQAQIGALRKAYYQRHHKHFEATPSDLSQTEVEQILDLYNT